MKLIDMIEKLGLFMFKRHLPGTRRSTYEVGAVLFGLPLLFV
jgi:hypothetical protein